jgi:hypothetical protein
MVGVKVTDYFGPAGAETIRQSIADALGAREAVPREVTLRTGPAQRVLHLRVALLPTEGRQGVMLILDDVTAEVRARAAVEKMNAELEETVRARTAQLEEANRLLMSYADFVSHDLRSPITAIKGNLGLIQEGLVPINAEAAALVSQAFHASTMMEEMVHNILQLARDEHSGGGTDPLPAVEPGPIVNRLVAHLRSVRPNSAAQFVIRALPLVAASPVLLERVFYNLLANALKYSESKPSPLIEVGARHDPAGPILFVRDNGIGFDVDEATKLFRDFSRLSNAQDTDGLGLGLSLVARLVRARGGRIWADGANDAGATFYVQFPPSREDRRLERIPA